MTKFQRNWAAIGFPRSLTREEKITFIAKWVDLNGTGLELGPHVEPMFRKSHGHKIEYLETRSTDQLRAQMIKEDRDPDVVEDIDYVLQRGRTLAEMTGQKRYEWVSSSHVVEHIPNFLGHLREVADVLAPGGVYAAIVPDRNFCFDCLKSPTTLGHILECHLAPETRPGALGLMIDEYRYGSRPDGMRVGGWTPKETYKPLIRKYDWHKMVGDLMKKGHSADGWFGHQWFFDPLSFAQIIADLNTLGLLPLQLDALQPTYNMDFIAILRKTEQPDPQKALDIRSEVAKQYRAPKYNMPV